MRCLLSIPIGALLAVLIELCFGGSSSSKVRHRLHAPEDQGGPNLIYPMDTLAIEFYNAASCNTSAEEFLKLCHKYDRASDRQKCGRLSELYLDLLDSSIKPISAYNIESNMVVLQSYLSGGSFIGTNLFGYGASFGISPRMYRNLFSALQFCSDFHTSNYATSSDDTSGIPVLCTLKPQEVVAAVVSVIPKDRQTQKFFKKFVKTIVNLSNHPNMAADIAKKIERHQVAMGSMASGHRFRRSLKFFETVDEEDSVRQISRTIVKAVQKIAVENPGNIKLVILGFVTLLDRIYLRSNLFSHCAALVVVFTSLNGVLSAAKSIESSVSPTFIEAH